jgi:hypothetical protein
VPGAVPNFVQGTSSVNITSWTLVNVVGLRLRLRERMNLRMSLARTADAPGNLPYHLSLFIHSESPARNA